MAAMLDGLVCVVAHLLGRRGGLHLLRVTCRAPHDFTPERLPAVRCGVVDEEELRRWCDDPAMELSVPLVRAALARGDVCIGAWAGDQPAGYQWLAFEPAPHVAGIWVQFNATDCYAYKKLVLPAWRGRRIAAQLSARADDIAAERGRQRVLSLISLDNMPSWNAARRTCTHTIGYVGFLGCFGTRTVMHSPGAVREGLGLVWQPAAEEPLAEAA